MKRQFVFQSFKIILNTCEKNQSTNPITLKKHILLIYHQIGAFFTDFISPKSSQFLCEKWTRFVGKKITEWLKTHWLSIQEGEKLGECDPPPPIVTCEICLLLCHDLVVWIFLSCAKLAFCSSEFGHFFHVLLAVQVVAYWLFSRHLLF